MGAGARSYLGLWWVGGYGAPPAATTGRIGKCCCVGCLIGEDDFNRADANPPTGNWSVVSGEWEIDGNVLKVITEGPIVTTLRQIAPVDSANYSYKFGFDVKTTASVWKIICKYVNSNTFDWIELYDKGGGDYVPKFWRRTGGADTLLMDPADYPIGGAWTVVDGMHFTICYSSYEWSISGSIGSFNWSFCLAVPATTLPSYPNGLVGFLDGDFDDFDYTIHKESDNECPDCTCYCWDGVDGKCLPEELTLTLTPVVNHVDCTNSPATLSYTMRQTLPDEPVTPPPDYKPYPEKKFWFSDPVEVMEPVNEPHPMWFRLECIGNGVFELILMVYPSGAQTAPVPISSSLIQFADTSGANGGSPATSVDCTPIIIEFSRFVKTYLQIGSGGPFTCTPFQAKEYDVTITE